MRFISKSEIQHFLLPVFMAGFLAACSSSGDDDTIRVTSTSGLYEVQYIEGAMGAMEGKSMFTLRISDSNGPASGLTPVLEPVMHMVDGRDHSTPFAGCTENSTVAGDYDCTIYYLMPSSMNGVVMGEWELGILVAANEEVSFTPDVMMAMGDTAMVKLKGQADMIKSMTGDDESRTYIIFRDSVTGAGPYTLSFFIAAKETMMSFPAVIVGNTLQSGMGGTPLTVNDVTVTVSANGSVVGNATDNLDGTWSIDLNLDKDVANTVEIELSVNGERKTSNGASDGLNGKFTITPGGM